MNVQNVMAGTKKKKLLFVLAAAGVILIAVIAGIAIYNTPANRLSRQVDLGNRYLKEGNYEQAVIAFDLAIAIDPKNAEALDGLEAAYLAYAQSVADVGDYERAISILEEGFEKTGRESLRAKIEEIMALFANESEPDEEAVGEEDSQEEAEETTKMEILFDVDTLSTAGCSMWDVNWFQNVCAKLGCPIVEQEDEFGLGLSTPEESIAETAFGEMKAGHHGHPDAGVNEYMFMLGEGSWGNAGLNEFDHTYWNCLQIKNDIDAASFWNLPLKPGDSYDDWYRLMTVDVLKAAEGYDDIIDGEYYRYRDEENEAEYAYHEHTSGIAGYDEKTKKCYMEVTEPHRRYDINVIVNGAGVIEEMNIFIIFEV